MKILGYGYLAARHRAPRYPRESKALLYDVVHVPFEQRRCDAVAVFYFFERLIDLESQLQPTGPPAVADPARSPITNRDIEKTLRKITYPYISYLVHDMKELTQTLG